MKDKLEMEQRKEIVERERRKPLPVGSPWSTRKEKKKKRMPCKLCPERFTDKVKLSQHMETHGKGPRYFKCDQCESKFKVMTNYVKHRQTKHVTAGVVVRKKVGTRIKTEKGDDRTQEMNANNLDFGEFVVDALYLDKDQLNCRVRNLDCFTTGDAYKMKTHREKFHQLLEKRISFEKWRHLLPARFLIKVDEIKEDKKEENVARIIENVNPDSVVSEGYEKKVLDPIMKDFGEYLKHRCAGR